MQKLLLLIFLIGSISCYGQRKAPFAVSKVVCDSTAGFIILPYSYGDKNYQLYDKTDNKLIGKPQLGNDSQISFTTGLLSSNKSFQVILYSSILPPDIDTFPEIIDIQTLPYGSWLGSISTDPLNPSNWCLQGGLPAPLTSISIPNPELTIFDLPTNFLTNHNSNKNNIISNNSIIDTNNKLSAGDCNYSLSSTYKEVSSDSGTVFFDIKTGKECKWEIIENCDWVRISTFDGFGKDNKGTGNSLNSIYYKQNTNNSSRVCTLIIEGKVFELVQKGIGDTILNINPHIEPIDLSAAIKKNSDINLDLKDRFICSEYSTSDGVYSTCSNNRFTKYKAKINFFPVNTIDLKDESYHKIANNFVCYYDVVFTDVQKEHYTYFLTIRLYNKYPTTVSVKQMFKGAINGDTIPFRQIHLESNKNIHSGLNINLNKHDQNICDSIYKIRPYFTEISVDVNYYKDSTGFKNYYLEIFNDSATIKFPLLKLFCSPHNFKGNNIDSLSLALDEKRQKLLSDVDTIVTYNPSLSYRDKVYVYRLLKSYNSKIRKNIFESKFLLPFFVTNNNFLNDTSLVKFSNIRKRDITTLPDYYLVNIGVYFERIKNLSKLNNRKSFYEFIAKYDSTFLKGDFVSLFNSVDSILYTASSKYRLKNRFQFNLGGNKYHKQFYLPEFTPKRFYVVSKDTLNKMDDGYRFFAIEGEGAVFTNVKDRIAGKTIIWGHGSTNQLSYIDLKVGATYLLVLFDEKYTLATITEKNLIKNYPAFFVKNNLEPQINVKVY
jgi:hypothetical protein